MSIDVKRLGRRMTRLRKLAGHSVVAMAARAGLPRSYLYRLEGGTVPSPGLQSVDAYARALGISVAELLAGKRTAR